MTEKWFCKTCNVWHPGMPPNCPNFKEETKGQKFSRLLKENNI